MVSRWKHAEWVQGVSSRPTRHESAAPNAGDVDPSKRHLSSDSKMASKLVESADGSVRERRKRVYAVLLAEFCVQSEASEQSAGLANL